MKLSKTNPRYISLFGIVCALLFVFFTVSARFILPFGDEPDFTVRAPYLVKSEIEIFTPYDLFANQIAEFEYISNCNIQSSPTSLWAIIDFDSCREPYSQILSRILLTLFIFSPVLFVIIFRGISYFIIDKISYKKQSVFEFNMRLDAIGISLIFPSMIYFSGVLALEQLVLALALLIIAFFEAWLLVLLLLTAMSFIDIGNTVIVVTFILLSKLMFYVSNKFGNKAVIYLALGIAFCSFLFGLKYISVLESVSLLQSKIIAIQEKRETFVDKYPIFVRPIITFLTGIFMAPSGVKSISLYLVVILSICFSYSRIIWIDINVDMVRAKSYLLASIVTILFFILALPDYSYAKYYVFMLPMLLLPLLSYKPKNLILLIVCFFSIIWLLNMLFYSI